MKATRVKAAHGVTLVELVVVLGIVAIVASVCATLVGRIVAGQQDNRGRLTLATAADAALARIADELQAALPNSVRVTSPAGGEFWIEWVPVLDAGRYRAASDTVAADPGDPLDLDDPADTGFDVIGTAITHAPAGSQLVFYNLGTPDADAYAGTSRRGGLALTAGGRHVSFAAAGAPPAGGSDGQRFFVVGTPVTLACQAAAGGGYELRRYSGYGWLTTQPASTAALGGATSAFLLGALRHCSAGYDAALANIGLLNLRLGLGDTASNARMDFLQQLAIDNTP